MPPRPRNDDAYTVPTGQSRSAPVRRRWEPPRPAAGIDASGTGEVKASVPAAEVSGTNGMPPPMNHAAVPAPDEVPEATQAVAPASPSMPAGAGAPPPIPAAPSRPQF